MKRRTLIRASAAAAAVTLPLAAPRAQRGVTVRWWYHFDNPTASPAELIAQFERENPGIRIQAENIPWGGGADYDTRMYSSVVANNAPDTAMVKFNNLARLLEMEALAPLDALIDAWPARTDIPDAMWALHRAPDGKRYFVPAQYVILYLYCRQDWFAQAGVPLPTTFDQFLAGAKALTTADRWGFGMRGGGGGHDHWGSFVVGGGATFARGGMVSEAALAANRWFIGLAREHRVFPPSAPSDGFRQIVDNFKAGRTAMTIHHIGSANEMVAALGDNVTAVPVPRGPAGGGWTSFGDGSNAVFAQSRNREAAWRWVSFLSTGAANVAFNGLSGQMTVTTSGARDWTAHPRRFVDATFASLPLAGTLPAVPQTADFTRTVWPQTTQRALLGQVTPDQMMQAFERHFHG